jgi:GntR family transcriptional regulator
MHDVSRVTARQALDELVSQGAAYRVRGRGTFVAEPRIREVTGLSSFSDEMRSQGLTPSSRVLVQRVVTAEESVRKKLKLAQGDAVIELSRVRLANSVPVPAKPRSELPPVLRLGERGLPDSPYAVLRSKYGVYRHGPGSRSRREALCPTKRSCGRSRSASP